MPELSLAALRKQIAGRKLAPVHLLLGQDVRLVGQVVREVEATIDPADQPFAVERIHVGDAGGAPIDIAAAARVMPMLGDRRIVFVMRAERLLKPKRASKTEVADEGVDSEAETPHDLGALEDYLDDPVPSSTVVFVATEVDKVRRFTKRLLQVAHVTTFDGLAGAGHGSHGASGWIRDELKRVGREIEPAALQLLVARAGGNITKLRGDVERLLLYTEGQDRIAKADVEDVASVSSEVDDWGVVNAIADGDVARALREVAARLDRGDSPHGLVGQLRWWVSSRLVEGAPDRVVAALDALLRTDLALKSSGGDDRVLIERLVIDLTRGPVSRPSWGNRRGR